MEEKKINLPQYTTEQNTRRINDMIEYGKLEPDRPREPVLPYMGRKKVWGGWSPPEKKD